MMTSGRADVVPETSTVGAAEPGKANWRLRPHQLLILAFWCGLLVGPLEVAAIVVRKNTYDLNKLYWMSRHFVWLIPLTNLLIFMIVGLGLALLSLAWPPRVSWLGTRLLCLLTLLAPFWAAFPRIYGPAGFVLALGVAARLVPALERRAVGLRRWIAISLPLLALTTPLLAASVWVGDWLKQRSEATRPLPPTGSPNVLLIVLDTVAAGHLSLYGYDRPTSPTLESLARCGIRFDRVQATSSWTLPSHASFFTGRWHHELSAGWLTPLDATYPTLAEYLGSKGYATAGFVANTFYCGTDTGLGRGFATYQDYFFPQLSAIKPAALVDRPVEGLRALHRFLRERASLVFLADLIRLFDAGIRKPAAVINEEMLGWLSQRPQAERPFFAFLNYFDVHYPYLPPPGGIHRFAVGPRNNSEMDLIEHWRSMVKIKVSARETAFARDSYDDCIANLDEQLGRLVDVLERRGVLKSTWLIITSDHGESFGERPGLYVHGTSLYQSQLHVPLLIIPPPSGPPPTRAIVPELVSLRDLPATIVDLLGLTSDAPFPGTSLVSLGIARPSAAKNEPPLGPTSPAFSEVVPTDPLDPDPAKLLEDRRAWASLVEGDEVYIRINYTDNEREELFDLREDPRQLRNLADDPAHRTVLERMRATLNLILGGPLTPQRFPI